MKDQNKIDKIKGIFSDEEIQEIKNGNTKVIDDSKGDLIERINKKIVAKDGRQLLREVNREVL